MALSTQPYKGARDFYPDDIRLQKYMFAVWRKVAERFGYEEYDAPILEPLEIYLAKTGDEIVNEQTYVFEDRGGRKVVIRPEMTPTVSRMVAARRQELTYPLRWYSIPNLWRYERPQRGRLREHWQLNVDIFGVANIGAEVEVITLVDAVFKEFGADQSLYSIHINSRRLTDHILSTYLGLDSFAIHALTKLIDRMHKMERTKFIKAVDEILAPRHKQDSVTEKLLTVLDATSLKDLPAILRPASGQLDQVIEQLNTASITNIKYDPSLMRGFDYYTDIVFEVFDTSPGNNRSMLGGGRYDGLVGLFGVDAVPTVGFGWGDVTLANFLETHNLIPDLVPETDVYVVLIGDVAATEPLANLRSAGLNVAVDLNGKKVGDQIKSADKKGMERVLIIGDNELTTGQFILKNLKTGIEEVGTLDSLIKIIKDNN